MFELNEDDIIDAAHKEIVKNRRANLIDQVYKQPDYWFRPSRHPSFKTASQGLDAYIDNLKEQLVLMASDRFTESKDRQFAAYRPINVLIQSPPGAGKSSLVRLLASNLRQATERMGTITEVNCSNLASYAELLPIFEQFAVLRENRIMPLAFFDEIDIPAWQAFQFLLMPMNEGAVISHGHHIKFGSAVFFFAASQPLSLDPVSSQFRTHSGSDWLTKSRLEVEAFAKSEKAPRKFADFFSRIDLFLALPGLRDHFVDAHGDSIYAQEKSVLAMLMGLIQRRFPQVQSIDKRVLVFLAGALPDSRRELEKAIFQSTVESSDLQFKFEHLSAKSLEGPWFKEVERLEAAFVPAQFHDWTNVLWPNAKHIAATCGLSFSDEGKEQMQQFLEDKVPAGLTKNKLLKSAIGDELMQTELGLKNLVEFMMHIVRVTKSKQQSQITPVEINEVYNNKSIWPYC